MFEQPLVGPAVVLEELEQIAQPAPPPPRFARDLPAERGGVLLNRPPPRSRRRSSARPPPGRAPAPSPWQRRRRSACPATPGASATPRGACGCDRPRCGG